MAPLDELVLKLRYLTATRSARRYRWTRLPTVAFAAPATAVALDAFAASHGIDLVPEHAGFLAQVGDGGSGPGFGLLPLARWDMDLHDLPAGFLAAPFPHAAAWLPPPDPEHGDGERFAPRHVQGSLRLCHHGGGVYDILVVSGPARGAVWTDAREQDQGVRPCAPSFLAWFDAWVEAAILDDRA